jgi:hypothetical protein
MAIRNQELEIMVIFQPVSPPDRSSSEPGIDTPESRGWNRGFFEDVIGGCQGEPLERPSQLPYEVREELTFGEGRS